MLCSNDIVMQKDKYFDSYHNYHYMAIAGKTDDCFILSPLFIYIFI